MAAVGYCSLKEQSLLNNGANSGKAKSILSVCQSRAKLGAATYKCVETIDSAPLVGDEIVQAW